LTNIVALVEQGRTIYQRILTWIINKISRTILKAAFVAIAFVVTGKFVVSAFAMLLLVFMTDFAKISLATDHVRPSKKPETWNIGGFITVSVVLGVAMVAETLLLLWIGWSYFGLATNNNALYTFSFLMLLYFAAFSVVSARERRWFWATLPSKTFLSAIAADALTGTVLTFVGLPGLRPLPWWQTLAIFAYAMISCLLVNDALKVAMIKWRVPNTVAKKPEARGEPKPDAKAKTPSDLTPQIAKRAYELYEKRGRQSDPAVQDWEQAKGEILKDEAKAELKPKTKVEPQSETKAEPKPEAKAEPTPEAKEASKPEAKAKPQPEAKAEPKAEIKPAAKAESEPETKAQPDPDANSKPEAKVDPTPATNVEPKSETKPDVKSEATPAPKPEAKTGSAPEVKAPTKPEAAAVPPSAVKSEPKPDAKTDIKPTDKVEPKPDGKTETKPEPNAKPAVEVSPQLVKKVHKFYEQLGREDVRAVEESDQAKQKAPEVETKK
jgi:hypothetical protein